MAGLKSRMAGIALLVAIAPATARAEGPVPELDRLKAHVVTLASPEYGGRRGEGGIKAAEYVEAAFRDLGLAPLFDDGYRQPIPGREPDRVLGRNVGAKLVGSDPELRDEWIIVAAHFDHLGVRNGVLYPGLLTVSQQFVVEYSTENPQIVRVAGRTAGVGNLVLVIALAAVYLVAVPLIWLCLRRARLPLLGFRRGPGHAAAAARASGTVPNPR